LDLGQSNPIAASLDFKGLMAIKSGKFGLVRKLVKSGRMALYSITSAIEKVGKTQTFPD
jgi:hypothetical protein